MIATVVSLRSGYIKLTSFSWSDKDTKTGISGNATDREYLDYFKASDKFLQYLADKIKRKKQNKTWASVVNTRPGC